MQSLSAVQNLACLDLYSNHFLGFSKVMTEASSMVNEEMENERIIDSRSLECFSLVANHSGWESEEKRKVLLKQIIHFTFPQKLFLLLNHGNTGTVEWNEEDPRSFRILDKDRLMAETVPKFFHMSNFRSFLRQLNIYGFVRCHENKAYRYQFTHQIFCRWDVRSVLLLQRREPSFRRGADRRTKINDMNESNSLSSTSVANVRAQGTEKKEDGSLTTQNKTDSSTQFTLARPLKDPKEFEFDPMTVFEGIDENFVVTIVE